MGEVIQFPKRIDTEIHTFKEGDFVPFSYLSDMAIGDISTKKREVFFNIDTDIIIDGVAQKVTIRPSSSVENITAAHRANVYTDFELRAIFPSGDMFYEFEWVKNCIGRSNIWSH